MNATQLINKIKDGKITVDTIGHKIDTDRILERVPQLLKSHLEMANEDPDNRYFKAATRDESYYTSDNNHCLWDISATCYHCGAHMIAAMKDTNTISFVKAEYKANSRVKITPHPPCIMPEPIPATSQINVLSGILVVQNYFDIEDMEIDKKYNPEYSLSSLLGRQRMAEHLSKSDVGYGQVGNARVDIYRRNDGKAIKIVESLEMTTNYQAYGDKIPTEIDQKAAQRMLDTHELIGEVSLDMMWRWMCADKTIANGIQYPNDEQDSVECNVEPGKWGITHYSDNVGNQHGFIVAELRLENA